MCYAKPFLWRKFKILWQLTAQIHLKPRNVAENRKSKEGASKFVIFRRFSSSKLLFFRIPLKFNIVIQINRSATLSTTLPNTIKPGRHTTPLSNITQNQRVTLIWNGFLKAAERSHKSNRIQSKNLRCPFKETRDQ